MKGINKTVPVVTQQVGFLDVLKARFPGARIYESDLQTEALADNTNKYNFNVLASDGGTAGNITPNEIRLNKTDIFLATHMAICIYKVPGATPTTADYLRTVLRTFPNPIVFPGVGEALNLEALYQSGILQVIVNDDVFVDGFKVQRFRRVGQAQQGTGPAVIIQMDEFDGMVTPYIPLVRPIEFNGNTKINMNISLPTAVNMTGTASVNVISILSRGFLVTGINSTGTPRVRNVRRRNLR
jgi:mRNA-degrading endonuclease toxin of MazEF toxin-antitoxin module